MFDVCCPFSLCFALDSRAPGPASWESAFPKPHNPPAAEGARFWKCGAGKAGRPARPRPRPPRRTACGRNARRECPGSHWRVHLSRGPVPPSGASSWKNPDDMLLSVQGGKSPLHNLLNSPMPEEKGPGRAQTVFRLSKPSRGTCQPVPQTTMPMPFADLPQGARPRGAVKSFCCAMPPFSPAS